MHALLTHAELSAAQVFMLDADGHLTAPGFQAIGTQTVCEQAMPVLQSAPVAHSAQAPNDLSQTWPLKHSVVVWRSVAGGRQVWALQLRPLAQLTSVRQATQMPAVVLQTWPAARHCLSEAQTV